MISGAPLSQYLAFANFALENFRYNVIIAVFHEIYSFLTKLVESNTHYSNLKENYKKILTVMMPVLPHIINECIKKINEEKDVKWPTVNEEFIENPICNIVIQINGKKRSIISVNKGLNEQSIIEKIKEDKSLEKHLAGKKIYKTIYIKDKILNFII